MAGAAVPPDESGPSPSSPPVQAIRERGHSLGVYSLFAPSAWHYADVTLHSGGLRGRLRAWPGWSVIAVVSALFAGALPASASATLAGSVVVPPPPYGPTAGTELDQLPFLQPQMMAGGVSSFDRDTYDAWHGNHDLDNFLSTDPDGNVMLDQAGAGCVYRIWMTSQQAAFPDQWIKVYFNGSTTPAIDMTIGQIFAGTNAPFLAPLVADATQSSGGYVSYVPLCYSRSIRIVTSMTRYYNIGYETFPPGTAITTWSPGQSTGALRQEWQDVTADPITTAGNTVSSGQASLDPGVPQTIFDTGGPDSIQSVKLTIPGVTAAADARVLTPPHREPRSR